MEGPLLLACNHPNSFLDAVILDILFKKPIWSLARGDVFKKPWHRKMLKRLRMFPVFRTSEGVENLENNYTTFEDCRFVFRNNGIVQMFSEGRCINEWHLRPLKKGTARLALSAWNEGIPLKVLPVGINYSSFRKFGKNIFINFGNLITEDMVREETEGKNHNAFNDLLKAELEQCVFEIPPCDDQAKKKLEVKPSSAQRVILFIPAMIGIILNAPLYFPIRNLTLKKMNEIEHYDSLLIALLVLFYPFYLFTVFVLSYIVTHSWWSLAWLIIIPFSAWAFVWINKQLDNR